MSATWISITIQCAVNDGQPATIADLFDAEEVLDPSRREEAHAVLDRMLDRLAKAVGA